MLNLDHRARVFQDVENLFLQYVRTDEDLERGATMIVAGVRPGETGTGEMENAALNMEKRVAKENALNGFYFSISVRQLAQELCTYLWVNNGVDDVFCDDSEMIQHIVNYIRNFNPANAV